MLEITDLEKRFTPDGEPLFSRVSFSLRPGECIAVMGESGVGKSTLLNCIAGLEPVDGGCIALDGEMLSEMDEDAMACLRRRKFGFVFQAFHVLPHLDLLQNVALPLWLLDIDPAETEARAGAMLESVGLGSRMRDWPRHLSGGELQRVAIARALVHRPALVLADEPTGNLDPERAGSVLNLLLESVRRANAAGVLVTHSHAAAKAANRIVRLTRTGLVAGD